MTWNLKDEGKIVSKFHSLDGRLDNELSVDEFYTGKFWILSLILGH